MLMGNDQLKKMILGRVMTSFRTYSISRSVDVQTLVYFGFIVVTPQDP